MPPVATHCNSRSDGRKGWRGHAGTVIESATALRLRASDHYGVDVRLANRTDMHLVTLSWAYQPRPHCVAATARWTLPSSWRSRQ